MSIERDVSEGLPDELTGHADLILENFYENKILVVEIKTQRGASFKHLPEPKYAHVVQLQVYIEAMKDMYPLKDIEGCVLYLDREGQNTPLMFKSSISMDLRGSLEKLRGISSNGIPSLMTPKLSIRKNKGPDSIYLKQPWQCEYCDYHSVSCPGALRKGHIPDGIVAKAYPEGLKFITQKKEYYDLIQELYDKH